MKKLLFIILLASLAFAGRLGVYRGFTILMEQDSSWFKGPIWLSAGTTDTLWLRETAVVADSGIFQYVAGYQLIPPVRLNLATDQDTGIIIYSSTDDPYVGIVVKMDKAGTGSNVKGIVFDGTNFDSWQDNLIYFNSANYWRADGRISYASVTCDNYYNRSDNALTLNQQYSKDMIASWVATKKGDFIIRDGHFVGDANADFFQLQDSAGVVRLQVSNTADIKWFSSPNEFEVQLKNSEAEGLGGSDIRWGVEDASGAGGNRIAIICDEGDIDTDFGLTQQSHPTLLIYNASANYYAKIYYGGWQSNRGFSAIANYYDMYINADRSSGDAFKMYAGTSFELTDDNAEQAYLRVEPRFYQTATASGVGLVVDVVESVVGSGGLDLLALRMGGVDKFVVDSLGKVTAVGGGSFNDKTYIDTIALVDAPDTNLVYAGTDTIYFVARDGSGYIDFTDYTLLFAPGWNEWDLIRPATNDSSTGQVGDTDNPYGDVYTIFLWADTVKVYSGDMVIFPDGVATDSIITQRFVLTDASLADSTVNFDDGDTSRVVHENPYLIEGADDSRVSFGSLNDEITVRSLGKIHHSGAVFYFGSYDKQVTLYADATDGAGYATRMTLDGSGGKRAIWLICKDDTIVDVDTNKVIISRAVSTTSGGVEIKGDAGSNVGYRLRAYNGDETGYCEFWQDNTVARFGATAELILQPTTYFAAAPGEYVNIKTGAGYSQYLDCGGYFYFRDIDNSSATVASISSAGGSMSIGNVDYAATCAYTVIADEAQNAKFIMADDNGTQWTWSKNSAADPDLMIQRYADGVFQENVLTFDYDYGTISTGDTVSVGVLTTGYIGTGHVAGTMTATNATNWQFPNVLITGGDTLFLVNGADSNYCYETADSCIAFAGDNPVRLGPGSVIIGTDGTVTLADNLVYGEASAITYGTKLIKKGFTWASGTTVEVFTAPAGCVVHKCWIEVTEAWC